MDVLYISTVFPKENENSTIYTDLAEGLAARGHHVTVVVAEEKKKIKHTKYACERNCSVLRVKTGNMYDVDMIKKGISILMLEYQLKYAINKYLSDHRFDFVLFESPPLTLAGVVKYVKRKYNILSYLMMKDIFPQNAVDLNIIKKGLIYIYFKKKEKELYSIADIIGCMSEANRSYLKKHNHISSKKIEIFPNTKRILDVPDLDKKVLRRKYGIGEDKVIFVFGGNMGKPQGISFLCKAIQSMQEDNKIHFLLIGRGTEKKYVTNKLSMAENVTILENLPRNEYEKLLLECDVGMVSLDYRFTIPNYPSRILSYMEYSIPVLAVTDKNTDFADLIKESGCGLWCYSNSVSDFKNVVRKLASDEKGRKEMGMRGRKYLEKHFNIDISLEILEKHFV